VKDLSTWCPCARPGQATLAGTYAHLEPYDQKAHGDGLYAALCGAGNADLWQYMPAGPFDQIADFLSLLTQAHDMLAWQTMVIRDADTLEILGMASYMRIREDHGSAEVGCVTFSKKLQRSRIATDAMYQMARHVFVELGYRRYEWKCDNANETSKRAALRFGFCYEGIFRHDLVVKGRNRDTAWYAMTDGDWPLLEQGFTAWLDPRNFGDAGCQLTSLAVQQGV